MPTNHTLDRLVRQFNTLPHLKDKFDVTKDKLTPEDIRFIRQAMNKAHEYLAICTNLMEKHLTIEDRRKMIGYDIKRDVDRLERLYGGI